MTYCLGIKVKEGLVGISDTRISAGTSTTVKKKVFLVQNKNNSFFIMTSGLRSVRDKAVHYFQELIESGADDAMVMHQGGGGHAFGQQLVVPAVDVPGGEPSYLHVAQRARLDTPQLGPVTVQGVR